MSKPLPIACNLSGNEQAERAGFGRRLAEASMTGWAATETGAELRFEPAAEAPLRELIAAESQCCAFLDFDLRAGADEIVVTVAGPPEARPIVYGLFGLA